MSSNQPQSTRGQRAATVPPVVEAYKNEFALAAASEVVALITLGLMITVIMPGVNWAVVKVTPGPGNTTTALRYNESLPVIYQPISLWSNSCATPAMMYTYDYQACTTALSAIEALGILACFFEIIAVVFGIMPFSSVSPRQPKVALTHAMLSQMLASLFALINWTVFFGALVQRVWVAPNQIVLYWEAWQSYVLVTSGGICAVAAWVSSFIAWVLALSAMIQYDITAAEFAVNEHLLRKEEALKRRAEIIARLGEGAARAAKEEIALELGDKLYLGGTVSAALVCGVAWANMGVTQYLSADPRSVPSASGAFMIVNAVATTTAAVVLMMGLTDTISRVKAAQAGFAVEAVVTALWILNFGMGVSYIHGSQQWLLPYEVTLGAVGIVGAVATCGVIYHPMKIWDEVLSEIPRPAKIFVGFHDSVFALAAGVLSVLAFALACGACPVFMYSAKTFVGYRPGVNLPPRNITMAPSTCPNKKNDVCNLGNSTMRCCPSPLSCVETSFTVFTCVENPFVFPVEPRTSYPVGQAFLALTLAAALLGFVFSILSLAPNGAIKTFSALSISLLGNASSFVFGLITYSVLQSFVLGSGGIGVPVEAGMLIGSWFCALLASVLTLWVWYPYYEASTGGQDALRAAEKDRKVEMIKLDTAKIREERMALESKLSMRSSGEPVITDSVPIVMHGGGDDAVAIA